ncbi:hypothetical protein GH714_006904 [Hevea brasiliensis]|uniref:Uncharacterized protein n=1 Tax=Hevea brasiliensis TaxID=3981 RepID=A0A6A6K411_HEVBR|nr:hypothetical protein GH714_006904 [Hevea brasiliensis]
MRCSHDMSALRHHTPPGPPRSNRAQEPEEESYNIIPIHKLLADQPSLRYPKVRAAAATLRTIGNLRKPPYAQWHPSMDLLDWLALFFGLQKDNVRNQQEHIVFHLANAQMLLTLPPDNIDTLDATVLRRFRMQYSLVSRETMWLGVRMFLKSAIAAGWIIVFGVFYGRIWSQKNSDGRWSDEASRRIVNFLEVALVFVLPELFALALFIIPRIRNFLENSNWRIFY